MVVQEVDIPESGHVVVGYIILGASVQGRRALGVAGHQFTVEARSADETKCDFQVWWF